jgi:hypothetical protein
VADTKTRCSSSSTPLIAPPSKLIACTCVDAGHIQMTGYVPVHLAHSSKPRSARSAQRTPTLIRWPCGGGCVRSVPVMQAAEHKRFAVIRRGTLKRPAFCAHPFWAAGMTGWSTPNILTIAVEEKQPFFLHPSSGLSKNPLILPRSQLMHNHQLEPSSDILPPPCTIQTIDIVTLKTNSIIGILSNSNRISAEA